MAAALTGPMLKLLMMLLCLPLSRFLGDAISAQEYREMRKRLRTLNKPAVTSIKTGEGDIFDCVDIYKQPAFDHPLLKNYTIPRGPRSYPKRRDGIVHSNATAETGLPGEGCPDGTVPIRRVKMEDLLRARSLSSFGKKQGMDFSPVSSPPSHYHWAQVMTNVGDFYGTYVHINLWKPDVGQGDQKFSTSQLWLVSGADDQFNSIEVGWMVCLQLFGDLEPRLFIYWTSDHYGRTGCYNTLCPGFVSVHKRVAIGERFTTLSKRGGDQFFTTIIVFKDVAQWWLSVNDMIVGFWPVEIFNHLNIKAEKVWWGGEVYNAQGTVNQNLADEYPPMGSGVYSEEGWENACFMKNILVVNDRNEYAEVPSDTHIFVDRKCYSLTDFGTVKDPNWRRTFFFGGPGGKCYI